MPEYSKFLLDRLLMMLGDIQSRDLRVVFPPLFGRYRICELIQKCTSNYITIRTCP